MCRSTIRTGGFRRNGSILPRKPPPAIAAGGSGLIQCRTDADGIVHCRPAAGAGNLAIGCRLPVAIRRQRNCPTSAGGAFAPRRKTRYNSHSTSRVRGEGSHSGLVRAPAKRLSWETGIVGSNPTPSAILYPAVIGPLALAPGISNGAGNGNGNRMPGAHRNLPSCRLITSGPSAAR